MAANSTGKVTMAKNFTRHTTLIDPRIPAGSDAPQAGGENVNNVIGAGGDIRSLLQKAYGRKRQ